MAVIYYRCFTFNNNSITFISWNEMYYLVISTWFHNLLWLFWGVNSSTYLLQVFQCNATFTFTFLQELTCGAIIIMLLSMLLLQKYQCNVVRRYGSHSNLMIYEGSPSQTWWNVWMKYTVALPRARLELHKVNTMQYTRDTKKQQGGWKCNRFVCYVWSKYGRRNNTRWLYIIIPY